METILPTMADCEVYANFYAQSLQVKFDNDRTAEAFRTEMDLALPEFYASVLVFSIKAKEYFRPTGSGKCSRPFFHIELREIQNFS